MNDDHLSICQKKITVLKSEVGSVFILNNSKQEYKN